MPRKNGKYTAPPARMNGEQSAKQTGDGQRRLNQLALTEGGTFSSVPFGGGGTWSNPLGFLQYDTFYTGTYATYRYMLDHPVIRLVRSICNNVMLASTWDYEPTDPTDKLTETQLNALKKCFNGLRHNLIKEFFVRGKDFGWAPGELIWTYKQGHYCIDRVKPLLQDMSEVLRDDYGNLVGIRNNVTVGKVQSTDLATPFKAWNFAYDGECGYPYGRSWLENIRSTAWRMWMEAAQQIARLGGKISGTVTVVTSPAGTFPDGAGKTISYRESAEKAILGLARGAAGVWFPSLGLAPNSRGSIDAMRVLADLAGKSLTNIDVKDFGSNSQAIGPLMDELKHAEELMFNGGLRSSRTGLEGNHGTKEEAGVHTDTGTVNAESDDEDFAIACQPLIDAYMVMNYGDNAKGRMRIKPPSLIDRKSQILRAVLLAILNNPPVAAEIAAMIDVDKLLDTLDIGRHAGVKYDAKAVKEASAKAPATTKQTEPQGGRPPTN